jgi:hypothetical protein
VSDWVVYLVQFLPISFVVSLVVAAMKEDEIAPIFRRGVRVLGGFVGIIAGISLVVYLVMLLFL